MNATRISRRWAIAAAAAVLISLIVLNWELAFLASAFATAEKRPSLLSDAKWGEPASARKFRRVFAPGTPETGLITWLSANKFVLDRPAKRAFRKVGGLPCTENVSVTWTATPKGKLLKADASVTEAGCL